MADGVPTTSGRGQSRRAEFDWDRAANDPAPRPPRDWKRLLLVVGLGGLSWVATFVGMLELIEANVGDLPLLHKAIIGFSVAMLMVMIVWLLDQVFSEIAWTTRLLFVVGYVFLTLISVGFGFGFYWKVLESRGEASRSAESAVGQVQNALHAGVTRLEQLQSTLDSLTRISAEKAAVERQSGTSCPGSRPGDGPRRQLRDDDAGRFKFAADFVRERVTALKSELASLNGDLAKVTGNDRTTVDASGTRNEFMRTLNRRLDMTVTGFNAFRTDPQLRQIRTDLAERSDRVTFPDSKGGTYQCPDAQLATALKGVVRAVDELPVLEKPKIAAVEGSEAVIEAFRRLSATIFGALSFKLPPSPEELRELQKKAVQSVDGAASAATQARLAQASAEAGLSKRDYIPLAIALFVDLCLLLVSIKRPGSALERLVPKMRAAERGPVIQILSRFNDIHRDPQIRESFEVFRHVVFDFHGDYYAAVPLNAPYRPNPRNGRQSQGYGVSDAEALVQEAHLLANLFASFEKERIFSRVMSPLITTSMIQKRLRRQGSKFANAEAFRIYRFRDGAWSDIILGAVMGAAYRVEGTERRRRLEEQLFAATEAARGPGADTKRGPGADTKRGPGADTKRGPGADTTRQPTLDLGAPTTPEPPSARPTEPATRRAADRPLWRDSRTTPPGPADVRPPFMPRVVANERPETEAPANSNTAPAARDLRRAAIGDSEPSFREPSFRENVVLHPAVQRPQSAEGSTPSLSSSSLGSRGAAAPLGDGNPLAWNASAAAFDLGASPQPSAPTQARAEPLAMSEQTVTIAATRETVTYTLPVSEARLPPGLLARTAPNATASWSPHAPATAPEIIATAIELPPPPRPSVAATSNAAAADEARASALRFGPPTTQA